MAVAFLFGTWLALREAKRLHLDSDKLVSVILVALVAGVLGARMLYVLEHVSEFRREWGSVLALWQGGLTLYGGLVAGVFGGVLTARRLGLPLWVTTDALAPSLMIGTAIGRVGCFFNGCCYGRPTSLPWGVTFPADSFAGLDFGNAKIHPAQLYFALAGVVLFGLVWALRGRVSPPGTLFWMSLMLFALTRIPLDFTRAYEPETAFINVLGIDFVESQLSSLAITLFSLLMILRLRRETLAPTTA
jgi:phosphatidylglycerol:prolipoprotein diacylglycerol transferase